MSTQIIKKGWLSQMNESTSILVTTIETLEESKKKRTRLQPKTLYKQESVIHYKHKYIIHKLQNKLKK